jgi:hypothetical protein
MHPTDPNAPAANRWTTRPQKPHHDSTGHKTHQAQRQRTQKPTKEKPSPHNYPARKACSPCTRGYREGQGKAEQLGVLLPLHEEVPPTGRSGRFSPRPAPPTGGGTAPAINRGFRELRCSPARGGTAFGCSQSKVSLACSPCARGYRECLPPFAAGLALAPPADGGTANLRTAGRKLADCSPCTGGVTRAPGRVHSGVETAAHYTRGYRTWTVRAGRSPRRLPYLGVPQ